MQQAYWEHFSHAADMGIRGVAPTLEGAFEQAALALTAVITEPAKVHPLTAIPIECQAPDTELLLVDWLNALIYEMATWQMLFSHFEVQIEGDTLTGRAWGESVSRKRHQPAVEVKGATYTELEVRQHSDGRWHAQCVVDV